MIIKSKDKNTKAHESASKQWRTTNISKGKNERKNIGNYKS